ncbi:peroxynitrite isomerase THAP4 [Ixodes scapularis]|uniref:peroxynitrite isomerase THAP4 n=1 Tax=Ixodes scapularis TaxID=6945 RepID=UPI001C385BDB|nr:peroxynitrite isomerase THAP4 [Ixodes scapularis]
MTGCSVTKCTNRADSGKSLYRIPTARHDVRRRLVWLFRMGRRSPTPKNARICEDHFESKEFETYRVNGRRKLKPNAVPSLLLGPNCHPATEEQSADLASPVGVASGIVSQSTVPQPGAGIASQVDVHSGIVSESVVPQPAAGIASQVDVHSASVSGSVEPQPGNVVESCDARQTENASECSDGRQAGTSGTHEGGSNREKKLELMLNLEQKKRRKMEKERYKLRESISRIFAPDQIRALEKGTMRGSSWSDATLQKALAAKVVCGSKGYEHIKENLVPLPAPRTLQQQMEHIKLFPGVLDEVFAALKQKVESVRPEERQACLLMDEMQIAPGLDYDASIASIIGRPKVGHQIQRQRSLCLPMH